MERRSDFLSELARFREPAGDRTRSDLTSYLRDRITAALFLGRLAAGDRLPSLRQIATELDVSKAAVVRVLNQLAAEGVIEKRDRSGTYVGDLSHGDREPLFETAAWLSDVLAQACEHQVRIPKLPELLERWTGAIRIRCACIESDTDFLTALCTEYSNQFGIRCAAVPIEQLGGNGSPVTDRNRFPEEVHSADFLITTAFHAPAARRAAELLGKPLVVASADRDVVQAIEEAVRIRPLTLVCADPAFGDRTRSLLGNALADRLEVVTVSDTDRLPTVDRTVPIILTIAARERLGDFDCRLLVPRYPAFSQATARDISHLLIQLHTGAERRHGFRARPVRA